MQIILASQSPRRQELLKRVVPTFTPQPISMKLLAKTAYQQNMWRKWLPKKQRL